MCFGQKSSFGFAFAGLLASWWIYSRTHNAQLATGVFFFFTMELLQGFQYFVIADDLTAGYIPGVNILVACCASLSVAIDLRTA